MADRRSAARTFAPDSKSGARIATSMKGVLQRLSEDIRTKALRSAAHAGAIVFYNEMKRRTEGIDDGPEGQSGTLNASIFRYHDYRYSGGWRQRYLIGPNKAKAKHWFNVEYGHWRVNYVFPVNDSNADKRGKLVLGRDDTEWIASKIRMPAARWVFEHPYARPSFGVAPQALNAVKVRLFERVRELTSGKKSASEELA